MNPLTCPEVEAQIELYAAGECDAATVRAVEDHLAHCPDCARACDEARRLVGLLDLHWRAEGGLRRLRQRIEAESRTRSRPRVLPLVRRAASLAAMLLLTFGLTWWLGGRSQPGEDFEGQLAVALVPDALMRAPEQVAVRGGPVLPGAAKAMVVALDRRGKTPSGFRRELLADQGTPRLPPPPTVDVKMEVRNTGRRELTVRLEDGVRLDLRGPGVVDVRAPAAVKPQKPPDPIRLAPGKSWTLPIRRLAYDSPDGPHYLYWTEPGVYVLTVRLKALLADPGSPGRFVPRTISSPPIRIVVE